jgi:hypothetical protein
MSLPRIVNPTPTTKPAVPEKTFPDIFIREIIITCKPAGAWNANVMIQPFNYDTGEVDEAATPNYISIADLKAEAATNEKLATVMYLLLEVIAEYVN